MHDEGLRVTSRIEDSPMDSQQENGDLTPTTARNAVPTTTRELREEPNLK